MSLQRNKIPLWIVAFDTTNDVVDEYGNYTGEIERVFSAPQLVYMSFYPYSGGIYNRIFGEDHDIKMVSILGINDVELNIGDLIFLNEPTSTDYTDYDYKLTHKKKSLNFYNYGFSSGIAGE